MLMKSEPEAFSIDDLKQRPKKIEHWDGVRNYQARNMMRDKMQTGDRVFFYHSKTKLLDIAGTMTVVKKDYPDYTAFDTEQKYYDPKSAPDKPRWLMVDVQFENKFRQLFSLDRSSKHRN